MDQINMLRPRCLVYMKGSEPQESILPFQALIDEINRLIQESVELRSKLIQEIQKINSRIDRYNGTQIATAWHRERETLKTQLGYEDANDPGFLINIPQIIDRFIVDEISTIKAARIESLRAMSKGLTDFFQKLKYIHNEINRQSRKISNAITENLNIDAFGSIGLLMTSRIDDLEYWNSLSAFTQSWEAWRASSTDQLPDQSFVEDMSTLVDALQNIKSGHNLRDYFDLHIHMVENGHRRVIRNDNELDHSTSDGLKYLALCVIFIAISRRLCPDKSVKLHWPIDELGILHRDNVARLFKMLNEGGVVMVGGFPSEDSALLRHFKHRQVIDFKNGIRMIDIPESILKRRLSERRQAGGPDEQRIQ